MNIKLQRKIAMAVLGLFALILMAMPIAAVAGQAPSGPTVNLDVTIAPGNIPTLTWDNPWAVSCNATGDWSGSKPPSGSETLSAITAVANYRLTCTGPHDNKAEISWQQPTQYVDGTPLPASDITGYTVWRGDSPSTLQRVERVTSLSKIVSDLSDTTHYFAVTTHVQNGTESAFSAIGSKTITAAPVGSDQEVIRVPNPPNLGEVR